MQGLIMITPVLLAAMSGAPTWSLILMAIIILAIIILIHRELWALFTRLETGIVLLVIVTILSIVGGLLPQHLTREDVAKEILGLPLPEVVTPDEASEYLGYPPLDQVPADMVAQMMNLPGPGEISDDDAIAIMGIKPAPTASVQGVYGNWLKLEYKAALTAKYASWFDEKISELGQPAETFYRIGFFMVYHIWYYLLFAYLLFICVVCCTIKRLSGYLRMRRRQPHAYPADRLRRQDEVAEFNLGPGDITDENAASKKLSSAGLMPKACRKDGEGFQFSLDFGLRLPGAVLGVIFHLAIFLMLIGFLATAYYEWRDEIWLAPGEKMEIKYNNPDMKIYQWLESLFEVRGCSWADPNRYYDLKGSFEIGCNDYFSEYRANGDGWYTLRDYKSDLYILDDGMEIKRQIIEVNFPLTYKGIDFFQQNVKKTGVLEITPPDGEPIRVEAGIWGTKIPPLPGLDVMLAGSSLVWGKLLQEGGGATDIGPTIRIGTLKPKEKENWPNPGKPKPEEGMGMGMGMGMRDTEWLFELKDGQPHEWNGYTFALKGPYEKATGLEVVHDPGVPILWIATIVLMIILILRVYFPSYAARVDLTPAADGRWRLVIAGRSHGLGAGFRKQAERIASILKSKGNA